MTSLADLPTPSLLLDRDRLEDNHARLAAHLRTLGVPLRPHVKTAKSIPVLQRILVNQPGGVTVSTLREAAACLDAGITDILYAVGIAPQKLAEVAALRARGANLTVILDSLDAAQALAAHRQRTGEGTPALIEIDSDGHRAGVAADSALLLEIAAVLGADLRGVMTHAGESYHCVTTDAKRAMAAQERDAVVNAAMRLRLAGHASAIVSVGSTPTAMFADDLHGVTEVRAGVYVFMDLVMAGLGVCEVDDIAISVLVTVIGHQPEKGWVITDGGWMALSRDRGTAGQAQDQGYGVVCDARGCVIEGLVMSSANQEHGILSRRDGAAWDLRAFPVGSRLRILPNHACATAAQYDGYFVLADGALTGEYWDRFNGFHAP
jgi:D-serine deaminase-like pyridoxal phosphate-dependent protein